MKRWTLLLVGCLGCVAEPGEPAAPPTPLASDGGTLTSSTADVGPGAETEDGAAEQLPPAALDAGASDRDAEASDAVVADADDGDDDAAMGSRDGRVRRDGGGNRADAGTSTTGCSTAATCAYRPAQVWPMAIRDGHVVRDAARGRDVPVLVRHPSGAPGPLPVIVWSHGGGANDRGRLAYEEWGTLLASAGYAVIHVSHLESAAGSHCAPLGIPRAECRNFGTEPAQGGALPALMYDRPLDVRAVLDDLAGIEAATGLAFDRARIGVGGHSAGAFTVMAVAGARPDFSPSVTAVSSLSDARPRAFLASSPQGIDRLGWTATSWDAVTRPVMVATGLADDSNGEDAASRRDPYPRLPAPDKYEAYLDAATANHATFGMNARTGDPALVPFVGGAGLAFFDAQLKGDAAAQAWLRSSAYAIWTGGVGTLEWK